MKLLTAGMILLKNRRELDKELSIIYIENASPKDPSKSMIINVVTVGGDMKINTRCADGPLELTFRRDAELMTQGVWEVKEELTFTEKMNFSDNQALLRRSFKDLLGESNTVECFKKIGLPFGLDDNTKADMIKMIAEKRKTTPNWGDWA